MSDKGTIRCRSCERWHPRWGNGGCPVPPHWDEDKCELYKYKKPVGTIDWLPIKDAPDEIRVDSDTDEYLGCSIIDGGEPFTFLMYYSEWDKTWKYSDDHGWANPTHYVLINAPEVS